MVTQFNEWVMQRFVVGSGETMTFLGETLGEGSTYFVDNYNAEFNRDIEPMKGGYTDNHYYQLVQNIRKFKGITEPQSGMSKTVSMDGNFSEWSDVTPEFTDPGGDTYHRNYYRYDKQETYVNNTGRNDVIVSKATYDNDNIYFYAQTASDLTAPTDTNWMLLFIDTDKSKTTGWEGYDYVVNFNVKSDSVTTISEWNSSDSSWTAVSDISYKYSGSQLEIQVPRTLIAQTDSEVSFYFHWADNIQELNDITEFFLNGDSAPDRRFNYNFSSSITTGTSSTNEELPTKYALMQNYPNPFNPTTTIQYDIPKTGLVEIKIYNLLGQVVKHLVDNVQNAGSYSIVWDGKNDFGSRAASGVYIYSLKSNDFVQSKKMLLLK
ncbi:MAG: T9SS type A sorting domain-containing protein [Ignavibacteria bacterium]|jgi:hypothetical protein